jgi:uncharacterized protein YdeI (YjbR/CyaY-like superfamily)
VLVFDDPPPFRDWLAANHATVPEAWIGCYRKATGKRSMSYAEAVDEALCFGWIDGIGYRVDDEVTTNRFTPRRTGSYWSAVNIGKVERLLAQGRMAPAGIAAFEKRDASAEARYSYENRPADLPAEMLARLREDEAARRYWDGQTSSYRRTAAFWVTSAKQEATRHRRLTQLLRRICESTGARGAGIDTSPFALTEARRRLVGSAAHDRVDLQVADATELDPRGDQDLVLCIGRGSSCLRVPAVIGDISSDISGDTRVTARQGRQRVDHVTHSGSPGLGP